MYRLIYQSIYLSRIPVIRIKYQSWGIILNIVPTFKFGLNILCSRNLYVSRSRVTLHSTWLSPCMLCLLQPWNAVSSILYLRPLYIWLKSPAIWGAQDFPICLLLPRPMSSGIFSLAFWITPSRPFKWLRVFCLFCFVFVVQASSALPPGKHFGLWNGSTIKTQLDTQAPNRYGREELAEAPPRFVSGRHASTFLSEALSLFYHLEQDAGVEDGWLGQDASEKTLEWRLLALPPTSFWPKVEKEEKTLIDHDGPDFIPTPYISLQVLGIK